MWSHSPPSGTVHRRPHAAHPRRSRTVAAVSERRSALLESVLAGERVRASILRGDRRAPVWLALRADAANPVNGSRWAGRATLSLTDLAVLLRVTSAMSRPR